MKAKQRLLERQKAISSRLCVGLDTEISKIPPFLQGSESPITTFNASIIESTSMHASAYKINTAFYEQYGEHGWQALKNTISMVPNEVFTIADAKRADIGNTSSAYARAIFDDLNCDAITVNPYMGYDSLAPFLEREDRMVIILALTSNPGSKDFQRLISEGKPLYQHVIERVLSWNSSASIGFVIGATHPDELSMIRSYAPDEMLLIPGIGAQGGDIDAIMKANADGPVMINVSRAIQYAGDSEDFGEKAYEAAQFYKERIGFNT
ncbi:orotidine 5'-phosphate decarboxylase [Chlorobiota bacterium]|nr:orotidine 5'-phosphate decarboxylase [Chlorobiota bacterium]